MICTIDELDTIGRRIINRLKHDEGSPKGKTWCDGYHEGLADMLIELKKEIKEDSLFGVCNWFIKTYPDDIFVSSDHPVHKIRDLCKDLIDYQSYCDSMKETNDKPLSFEEWKKLDKEKHNES